MNEPKSIDKICPILGSQIRQAITHVKGIQVSGIQSTETIMSLCVRDKCQLWDEQSKHCSFRVSSSAITGISPAIIMLNDILDKVIDAIRDLKEEKHDNL